MKLAPGHFYGEILYSREVADFRLMENIYPSHIKLPKHSHSHGCFSVMLRGTMTENYGKTSLNWIARNVGFNPPHEEHSNIIHSVGASFFIVEVSPDWLRRAREFSMDLNKSATFREGIVNWLGFRLYNEARQLDEVSELVIEGLMLEMMAEVARFDAKKSEDMFPRWLRQVKELIHAQFAEPLTVSSIAKTIDVHPVHLARTFRKHYRSTIGDYIRCLRIEFACREICKSEASLAEIAAAAGFYDQGHLSRSFKRLIGITPAEYRKMRRPR